MAIVSLGVPMMRPVKITNIAMPVHVDPIRDRSPNVESTTIAASQRYARTRSVVSIVRATMIVAMQWSVTRELVSQLKMYRLNAYFLLIVQTVTVSTANVNKVPLSIASRDSQRFVSWKMKSRIKANIMLEASSELQM